MFAKVFLDLSKFYFRLMKYSASKENYLKAIFHLQEEDGIVTTNELAAALLRW